MLSSEKSQRNTSSISKKNKRKEVVKTTEEMPKSQSKGKFFFFFFLKLLTRSSGIMRWVLEQHGDVLLMQRNYLRLLMVSCFFYEELPEER